MANQALADFQATLNRFASVADFSPLVIDGGMGANTEMATQNALVFACERGVADLSGLSDSELDDLGFEPPQAVSLARGTACNLRLQLDDKFASGGGQTFIMQNLHKIKMALSVVADEVKLPLAAIVNAVKPQSPSNVPNLPDRSAFDVKPPPSMGSFERARLWLRQAPQWQQVGIGVGGGIALLLAFAKLSSKDKKPTEVAGYRRKGR